MADRQAKKPDLGSYVEVKDRVREFYQRHPEGIIRTRLTEDGRPFRIVKIQGEFSDPRSGELVQRTSEETYVCVVAEARRAPGEDWFTASSMEQFPGRTPYTRNSELENAETSAWGRVLAAMGIGTDKSMASAVEVRNRQAERDEVQYERPTGSARTSGTTRSRNGARTGASNASPDAPSSDRVEQIATQIIGCQSLDHLNAIMASVSAEERQARVPERLFTSDEGPVTVSRLAVLTKEDMSHAKVRPEETPA